MIALLHDLTHAPFGHTLEDEIKLVHPSHDDPKRQADAFLRLLMEYLVWTAVERQPPKAVAAWERIMDFDGWLAGEGEISAIDHENVVKLGIGLLDSSASSFGRTRLTPKEFAEVLIDLNFATRALYFLEVSHSFDEKYEAPQSSYLVNELIEKMLRGSKRNASAKESLKQETSSLGLHEMKFDPLRDAYCIDLIGNTICADLLDYANRDAANSGLPLSFDVSRIVEHFTIISYKQPLAPIGHPFNGFGLRAAVEFSNTKFRGDVIGELMQLLQVRYYVYERMLFHPTKCVAGAMLGRAVQLLGFTTNIPERWQLTGDAVFMEELADVSRLIRRAIETSLGELSHGTDTRYYPDIVNAIEAKLVKGLLPVFDCARNAVSQRLLTIGGLKKGYAGEMPGSLWIARYLYSINKMAPFLELQALDELPEILKTERWQPIERHALNALNATVITPAILLELATTAAKRLSSSGQMDITEARQISLSAYQKLIPSMTEVLEQIQGARRLTSRLSSRRFAKRIFCLLPRNIMANDIKLERAMVAKRFLDPNVRMAAERAIEQVGKLPSGSVVIHCPPASGPTKLAKVIVTYVKPGHEKQGVGSNESCRANTLLRTIGDIEGPANEMFKAHQSHINSMEQMYSSMWRLWVAVTPPLDKDHKALGQIISRVMSAVVFAGGSHNVIQNDAFMIEELKELYAEETVERENETTQNESPKSNVVEADRVLTKDEISKILEPYLATFATRRRKEVEEQMEKLNVLERLHSRCQLPDFSARLSQMKITGSITAAQWDARDIKSFVKHISQWANVDLDRSDDKQPAYRRLNREERQAKTALGIEIARKLNLKGIINTEGAVRIAALIRKERNLRVVFQPLMTSGLYADSPEGPAIYVNTEGQDSKRLENIFLSEEKDELLPPQVRFTLAHELIHHLITTGQDSTFQVHRESERMNEIAEIVCQTLAAETLVSLETINILCAQDVYRPERIDATCRRLGVHIRPLLIRLDSTDQFENLSLGVALVYCRLDRSGDLLNIQCAASRSMSGPVETLRNLVQDSALPFCDLLGLETINQEESTTIQSSSTNRQRTEKVSLKMQRAPSDSSSAHRLVVVTLE